MHSLVYLEKGQADCLAGVKERNGSLANRGPYFLVFVHISIDVEKSTYYILFRKLVECILPSLF